MQPIFCNNCGDRGHPFKDCKKPVLSCGIILIRNRLCPNKAAHLPIEKDDIEVLMIRRKDSMSYTEFMRGKYDVEDPVYIRRLLENMTSSEIMSLKTTPFETLWARMWNFADRREHELAISKEKYNQITQIVNNAQSVYSEQEWGFPKGRRFRIENDFQCAEREFFEETNITKDLYIIVRDVVFSESFLGTNGIPYEHKYFMAVQLQPFNIHKKFTLSQKREISAIGWKSLSECMSLTRPHYSGREALLSDLSKFVVAVEVRIPNLPEKDNGDTCSTNSS
jgi:8-oxo-dGTP pyrophosphatase MutT (NUDIX family)